MDNTTAQQIEDLLAKVALGNRDAYQQLYAQTSAKLLGVCLRILNDRAEAEDALQETFVRVWQKASTFEAGKARGITWLAAIARNHSIDRARARRPFEHSTDEMYHLEDETPGPAAVVIASGEYRRIQDCLAELDGKLSRAVKMAHLNGWTYQQAAEELKVPLNTIKTWIRRGLIALRECMNR